MNHIYSKRISVCVVVETLGLYKTLYPKLKERFDVTTVVMEDKPSRNKRFDKKRRILAEVTNVCMLFLRIRFYLGHDVTVCLARKRHLSFLAIVRILKLFGVNVKLYLYGFYIQSWASNAIIKRLVSIVFTENIALLVISKSDLKFLQSLAPNTDIRYYPYCQARRKDDDLSKAELGDYIFSGGHTNRDYDTLIECAEKMPQDKFVIVCSQYTKIRYSIPSNVKVYKDLEGDSFYNLLAKSRLVVIPLLIEGYSSGQTVAIESMQYGKAIIYSNFENVSQYFDDGITGIQYISGDVSSLEIAIEQVVRDEERLIQMGKLAQKKYYRYYTKDKIDNALVTHIENFSKVTAAL